jgi:DNA-binding response OmpR family regulator
MRILLVEDDRELAEAVARALKTENFVVDLALNGEDGQHFGDTEPYDAAVLDLGLPKVTGVAVLKAWRAAGRGLPVLILTARDGWSDKVEGFKAGADDYLVKPFRMEELVMRLRPDPQSCRTRVAADRLRAADLRCAARLLHAQRHAAPPDGAGVAGSVLSRLATELDSTSVSPS